MLAMHAIPYFHCLYGSVVKARLFPHHAFIFDQFPFREVHQNTPLSKGRKKTLSVYKSENRYPAL
jgi:hypothetical protein